MSTIPRPHEYPVGIARNAIASLPALLELYKADTITKVFTRPCTGDALLKLTWSGNQIISKTVTDLIMSSKIEGSRAEWTRVKSNLVQRRHIAFLTRHYQLHFRLILSSNQRAEMDEALQEDLFKAWVGGVNLDFGEQVCQEWVSQVFKEFVEAEMRILQRARQSGQLYTVRAKHSRSDSSTQRPRDQGSASPPPKESREEEREIAPLPTRPKSPPTSDTIPSHSRPLQFQQNLDSDATQHHQPLLETNIKAAEQKLANFNSSTEAQSVIALYQKAKQKHGVKGVRTTMYDARAIARGEMRERLFAEESQKENPNLHLVELCNSMEFFRKKRQQVMKLKREADKRHAAELEAKAAALKTEKLETDSSKADGSRTVDLSSDGDGGDDSSDMEVSSGLEEDEIVVVEKPPGSFREAG